MRNTRLKSSCLALSLIVPLLCLSMGSSGASAASISGGTGLLETATPLVVEVGKWKKGKWGGNKYRNKNWGRYGGKRNNYYVRRWNRRPHYGAVVAGVTLGTILGVAAAGASPGPRAGLCWYWTDASMRSGYYDYCY